MTATVNDQLRKLNKISEKFNITFVVSISVDGNDDRRRFKDSM